MQVRVIRGEELGKAEEQLWSGIQASDPALASPYFCPQFTRAVSAARDDMLVGVLEEGNRTVGFFPFHLQSRGVAAPATYRMADYEGVVTDGESDWTAEDLLRGCGLKAWHFEVIIGSQAQFEPYCHERFLSPILDLSRGFAGYAADIRRSGSRAVEKTQAQRNALERDHGQVLYEAHVAHPAALSWLMGCKSMQYQRTQTNDRFQESWFRTVLELVHATQDEGFAGVLSALYAGDRMVAAHMGVRSRTAWHYWFPCYDTRFGKYSPGSILLLEMAKSAEGMGLRYIDMGRHLSPYKARFGTSGIPTAAGQVVVGGGTGSSD